MAMSESEKVIRTLYEISTETEKGFPHQIGRLLKMGCERFRLDIGILSRIEDDVYSVMHKVCPPEIPLKEGDTFELGNTYCAVTLEANKPVAFEHVAKSEMSNHPAYRDFKLEAYFGVPIIVNGKPFGTLNFTSPYPQKRKFNNVDIDALQLMASWISAELRRIDHEKQLLEANKKLEELASKDSLTNLYNRRFFQESLEHMLGLAKRYHDPLSLIIIDVDKFKQYNDSYGHLEGDVVLKEFASMLQKNCRSSDYVARLGGEEFAVILPSTNKDGAVHYAEDLRKSFEQAHWPNRDVTASFGVSTIQDLDEDDPLLDLGVQMLRQADLALYRSKKNGRNRVTHFEY